jgi:Mn2+/Fe2+ NRAMP family transporter
MSVASVGLTSATDPWTAVMALASLGVYVLFLVRIINDRRVMGIYRNGRLANVLSYLTIIVVVVLSLVLLVMQVLGIG